MLIAFVIFNGVMMLGMSLMLSARRPTKVKGQPYESGIPPIGTARGRFSVKFYLVAMLFVVFDVETVFLFPWAVAFRAAGRHGLFLFVAMPVFLAVLAVGLAYAWKRGALDWE